ncbi:hypothetical protein [Dechloromonas sp. A34]|uniref:hypothetical protein n=1 Tax=Dechloromonas sp. A34 TaxID=447588 RepID=UPI002248D697|nr:hypothetical protein [Dechloromonas sp. A34]
MAIRRFAPMFRQAGISIIEIMITLVLGLFIIGGALYTFLSTRTAFVTNDAIAKIQEDGRMVMERLTREIRQAGFLGCANSLDIPPKILSKTLPPTFAAGDGVRVFNDGTGWTNTTGVARVAGTDVIELKGMSSCTSKLDGNMTADNANIQIVSNPCGWTAGAVLVIADCTSMDIFTATSVSKAAGKDTIAHASDVNIDNKLSKAYGKEAIVFGYGEKSFFVGMHPTLNLPMLYETSYNGTTTTANDVVANVYDLQVLAVRADSNADSAPDVTVTSTGSPPALGGVTWSQALSLQLRFSVRSESDNAGPSSSTYTFNGASVTDKRIKRDFTTVIGIRNRLP